MCDTYLAEIAEQPQAIARVAETLTPDVLARVADMRREIEDGNIRHVIITAMGGSLYSAYGTWLRLSQFLPVPVSLLDASELVQQMPDLLRPDALVIAISQSGESAELRHMAEIDKSTQHRISITNGVENTVNNWSRLVIATHAGPEQTVSTKTYTAGLVALYGVEAALLGQTATLEANCAALVSAVGSVLSEAWQSADTALQFLGPEASLTFIGRGASYGSAAMAALVTAEAAKAQSQALTAGQFRHGPLELVRDGFRAVLFSGERKNHGYNARTVADILRFGGRCLVIGPEDFSAEQHPNLQRIALPEITPALLPVLELLPIQHLMVPMARARGFVPAEFLNGKKVTVIE